MPPFCDHSAFIFNRSIFISGFCSAKYDFSFVSSNYFSASHRWLRIDSVIHLFISCVLPSILRSRFIFCFSSRHWVFLSYYYVCIIILHKLILPRILCCWIIFCFSSRNWLFFSYYYVRFMFLREYICSIDWILGEFFVFNDMFERFGWESKNTGNIDDGIFF